MPRRRAEPEVLAVRGDLVVERDRHRPSGRLLRQGDMEASYVDLADAGHLEFDYMRRMRDLAEAIRARRVVHVGGAGCALARALATADPRRRQLVAEVDADVLELARAHLGLRRAPGLRVRHGDGRALLAAEPDASADAILVDAFVGARVPRHLVTAEALADAARVLAPRGALAINVVDVAPLADARAIAAGLCDAFATVAALGAPATLRARRGGNVVLLAAHGSLPLERLRVRAAADREPAALLAPAGIERYCGGAAPWRD
ncbi:MAG: spermidine synthase [Solirubrobacteraceae bacterium]